MKKIFISALILTFAAFFCAVLVQRQKRTFHFQKQYSLGENHGCSLPCPQHPSPHFRF